MHAFMAEVSISLRTRLLQLDKRIEQVRKTTKKADGRSRESAEAVRALEDLRKVRGELSGAGEALLQCQSQLLAGSIADRLHEDVGQMIKPRVIGRSVKGVEATCIQHQ